MSSSELSQTVRVLPRGVPAFFDFFKAGQWNKSVQNEKLFGFLLLEHFRNPRTLLQFQHTTITFKTLSIVSAVFKKTNQPNPSDHFASFAEFSLSYGSMYFPPLLLESQVRRDFKDQHPVQESYRCPILGIDCHQLPKCHHSDRTPPWTPLFTAFLSSKGGSGLPVPKHH